MESQNRKIIDVIEHFNIDNNTTITHNKIGESAITTKKCSDLLQEVNDELDKKGQRPRWICYLFLIATLPNILNGYHVSSYIFLGKMPENYWCEIPVLLNNASWSQFEMLQISTGSIDLDSCSIFNYDYNYLSTMTFASAQEYIATLPKPESISCLSSNAGKMQYVIDGSSIVPDWDLVCEHTVWRTVVQVAISVGKCVGAFSTGILSDKYGRKILFAAGCVLYTLASIMCTFSPWYWMFLVGRFFLGAAASGLFYPPLITMTENVVAKHRHWLNIFFNHAYPVGMLYLALAGFLLNMWRELQLMLSVPALVLFGFYYIMDESPRWLLSKGRTEEAYKVVFGQPVPISGDKQIFNEPAVQTQSQSQQRGALQEIVDLYGKPHLRRIIIICNYAAFTAAFCYYVTAINAANLSADRVVYVSATAGVDMLAYCGITLLLTYVGRKWSCFWAFAMAAVCMFIMMLIPREQTSAIVAVSMVGRLGISAVYATCVLYTSELFPTEVRNSAVGVCSMCGHIGSILAPFAVDFLGKLAWFVPTTICGCALLLAGLLVLLNPETSKCKLVDHVTIEDAGRDKFDESINKQR